MEIKTLGSICSGIEAASLVFKPLEIQPIWLSEIAAFPSSFLAYKYPEIPNLGDMNEIAKMIDDGKVEAPDIICGGTPCQAFSLAGWRNGINDHRGQLTLTYIDIINSIDKKRLKEGKDRTVFFWENVEGVLTDKTNAFGCFLAGLLGLDEPLISHCGINKTRKTKEGSDSIIYPRWPNAGIVYGKDRNIAWRVLDAKYFGLPQQRRRIYVLGGGKNFHPEYVLFEEGGLMQDPYKTPTKKKQPSLFGDLFDNNQTEFNLTKTEKGNHIEAFRSYSDCLYAAYGTKWNGNAAAFNGSLYFAQNGRLRRLDPLECERLMGLPDNYTLLEKCKDTQRYQAVGNSWAVPTIRWIANRLINTPLKELKLPFPAAKEEGVIIYLLEDFNRLTKGLYINASQMPYDYKLANMVDIVDIDCPEKYYITPKGCTGILRRKYEHNAGMNHRLEEVLKNCSDQNELKRLGIIQ